MKYCILFLLISVSQLSNAQKTMVFYDSIYHVSVPKVQVSSTENGFVGLSNANGAVALQDVSYPLQAKHFGYQTGTIAAYTDTFFLVANYQEIEEVVLKPVNKMELYTRILTNSSEQISRSNGILSGTYFESVMIINPSKKDTVFLNNSCDMIIQKTFEKKKYSYQLYCANGQRNYRKGESSTLEDFDTTVMNKMLSFLDPFKKYLKYDLVSTKPYKLKFEEDQISREMEGELYSLTFEEQEKFNKQVIAEYRDETLYTWEMEVLSNKIYDGEGLFINRKKEAQYIEFSNDPEYFVNSIIANGILQVAVDGEFVELHVVKGFLQDSSVDFELNSPYKQVKNYFENIEYSNESIGFYKFELK
ncbi:MAG: hypothetical protein QNK23_05320 [Crocinitomicaceae bacterium]|nr:hypothetical protein [Crocinitomicaceae bacterium]